LEFLSLRESAPLEWRPLIGEDASNSETVIVLERDGKLYAFVKGGPTTEFPESVFYRESRRQGHAPETQWFHLRAQAT